MSSIIKKPKFTQYNISPLTNSNWIYDFLRPLLPYGRLSLVYPFDVVASEQHAGTILTKRKFILVPPRSKMEEVLQTLVKAILVLFLLHRMHTYDVVKGESNLDWVCQIGFAPQIMYTVAAYVHLRTKGKTWKKIFKQSGIVLEKFAALGWNWTQRNDYFLGTVLCVCAAATGISHIVLLKCIDNNVHSNVTDDETLKHLPFLDYGVEELNVSSGWKKFIFIVTQLPDVLAMGSIYYGDALRLCLAIVMRRLYANLNQVMFSKKKKPSTCEMNQIINLHFNITKLMRLCNELVSPLIFTAMGFILTYSCYYINFMMISPPSINRKILFFIFYARNISFLLIAADVNTKAHRISEWLEEYCSGIEQETDLLKIEQTKLMILTTEAFNKDSIGFSGLNYFIVSTSFITTIVSVILSYTLIITQLQLQPK